MFLPVKNQINMPALGSFYSIEVILRHMNKNVKFVPKIIQNVIKQLNLCNSNGFRSFSRLYFYVFSFRFVLLSSIVFCIFSYFYSSIGLFMLFCMGFLHNFAQFVYILTFYISFRFLLHILLHFTSILCFFVHFHK